MNQKSHQKIGNESKKITKKSEEQIGPTQEGEAAAEEPGEET